MRIATYNLRAGGAAKIHWQRLLDEHAVDLLLVQESHHPDEHLPPLLFPDVAERSVWRPVSKWGSGIYCATAPIRELPLPDFGGWVVGAEVDTFLAFSLHARGRHRENWPYSYQDTVSLVLDRIAELAVGREVVLGGDFNLTISESQEASAKNTAIHHRIRDELGLVNCWKACHPDEPLAQTLRWAKDPSKAYHCDGLFVPAAWTVKECYVVTEWEQMSDHNPVVAEVA